FQIFFNTHLDRIEPFISHLGHMVRPVLSATFFFDRSIFGHQPAGYHVLNLLLHLGSSVLVYRILSRAVSEESRYIPFWVALLFLLHPIQTETVTYISGRASGLMAFFYLLALVLYIKASEHSDSMKFPRLCLSGAVASFLLSVGSKEPAVTFPVVLLLWDILIRRLKGAELRAAILSRHFPFWVVCMLAAAWAWNHPRYTSLAQFSLGLRPFWDNLLSEVHAVSYALLLFFCPWNLNFDHDLPIFHSLFQWPLPLDGLMLGALATAGLLLVRRLPLFAFGVAWFFLQLLPSSLIPRADLLSERNLYLASIGFLLAIVVPASHLIQWIMTVSPRPQYVRFGVNSLAVILVIVLCLFTFQRNMLYGDEVSLWSDTVRKSANKARPHNNLGHAYAMEGDWDRAIDEFRLAVTLDPDYVLAQKNLRDAYLHHVRRQ
ncbi:MAG TPA: tetratricopeptide repeat protein, partial [Nitrospiraceae bacterium]